MINLHRLPFADWCWMKQCFPDEDGNLSLRAAAKILGCSVEQVVSWLKFGQLDSLALIDIEAAYNSPLPKGIKKVHINPWTGAIE